MITNHIEVAAFTQQAICLTIIDAFVLAALATVNYHAFNTALVNPAKTLKYE